MPVLDVIGLTLANGTINIFERLQQRDARDAARRDAVWRWVRLAFVILIFAAATAELASLVAAFVHMAQLAGGVNGDFLLRIVKQSPVRLLVLTGWGAYVCASFARQTPGAKGLLTRLDIALEIVALSCWSLALFRRFGLPWVFIPVLGYAMLNLLGLWARPGSPRKPGRLH